MVISKRGREKIGGMIEKSKRVGGGVDRTWIEKRWRF